jgi:predicted secreted acid phosphatase
VGTYAEHGNDWVENTHQTKVEGLLVFLQCCNYAVKAHGSLVFFNRRRLKKKAVNTTLMDY